MTKQDGPSWRYRRIVFAVTMTFSALVIFFILFFRWDDSRLSETAVVSAFALWGAVVGTYGVAATWEDIKLYRPDRGGVAATGEDIKLYRPDRGETDTNELEDLKV